MLLVSPAPFRRSSWLKRSSMEPDELRRRLLCFAKTANLSPDAANAMFARLKGAPRTEALPSAPAAAPRPQASPRAPADGAPEASPGTHAQQPTSSFEDDIAKAAAASNTMESETQGLFGEAAAGALASQATSADFLNDVSTQEAALKRKLARQSSTSPRPAAAKMKALPCLARLS